MDGHWLYDYISVPCCSWAPEFRRSSHGETASVLRKREALKWSAKSQTIWKSATFPPLQHYPGWITIIPSPLIMGCHIFQRIPPNENSYAKDSFVFGMAPADLKDFFWSPTSHLENPQTWIVFQCVCVQISASLLNKTREKKTHTCFFGVYKEPLSEWTSKCCVVFLCQLCQRTFKK